MMFANMHKLKKQQIRYKLRSGFRLGVGLNAGYSTNDPYKLALEQMLEDNTIYQKDTLTLTTGYTNLFQAKRFGQTEGKI
jgi:hypothetical protein